MEKSILNDINLKIFHGAGKVAGIEEKIEYMKTNNTWKDLLVFSKGRYVSKSPFSGDCMTKFIYVHIGDWKVPEFDSGTTLFDLNIELQHPYYQKFLSLGLNRDHIFDGVLEYLHRGDIDCARAEILGLYDSGQLKKSCFDRAVCVIGGITEEDKAAIRG